MDYDITVTGGLVVDGTGTPARRADVAITAGRIAAIGEGPFTARTTIDASGAVIAPGFVDLHSHADFTLPAHPAAETQLAQGVTTLIAGNCGHSPFPLPDPTQTELATVFTETPLPCDWTDARGFGTALEATRPAVNVGLQLGHNALRSSVVGAENRPPTASELDEMCRIVRDSAGAPGVVGFSTGLIYMPGLFAGTDELRALVAAAAASGLLYSTHMRDETSGMVAAVEEAIGVAEAAGARLQISHLKAMGPENWGAVDRALELIDAARARGVDVTADVYPYTASSTDLSSRLARWAVDGGREALLVRLADPVQRTRIADALRARFGRDIDPDGVVIADLSAGEFDTCIGMSISQIGAERGTDAAEAALDVLAAHQGSVAIVNHAMDENDVRTVLAHPWVAVASDGWVLTPTGAGRPHPRSFGTFPRVLGRYVREQGTLRLEEAIRKMTSLPASRIGLDDRGVLAEGAAADVVVFDPSTVDDASTFDDPWQLARGVRTVLVNGTPAVLDGKVTGARAGRLVSRSK
ncbi:amidohydrolase family protein [Rhodococcus hoagii]|uniref:N-acyl-D-amino-acid deacylase family protein n=1 Tax=Rhodococcus hoagii TaxID=43767 RepID=UPI0007CD7290|nr:D-aminoacylase [Prescottella equi]MBM4534945.1 amidohydrolase family protein [Prescottella equi]MBM4537230.1 amidohydrolase family protein [Prescottella equi]MBM4553948.1 amidohydrolase family protein [Prescottella equi]MBM4556300.1 amidohydrolase family protein [Prescottella equi]NKR80964.1 amidohydrolase family protein [Prescottella equi]